MEAVAPSSSERLGLNDEIVRAAGAVVWRRREGRVEVLLVHRPKYDDWSFPKGKSMKGESDEQCAIREVEEETNLRVTLGAELVSTSYVSKGQAKRVRYWLAKSRSPDDARAQNERAQNEVDELGWLPPQEAAHRLTYARDRGVLRSALERVDS